MDRISNWPNIRQKLNTELDIRSNTEYFVGYPAEYRIFGRISGRIQNIWWNIRPNTEYMIRYAEYRIHGRISGRTPNLYGRISSRIPNIWSEIRPNTDKWPDIRPNTWYLVGYPAEYRTYGRNSGLIPKNGRISGRIPDIWLDIRPN